MKFQQSQGRRKNEVCTQGIYTTQNFIIKASIVFYSITKENLKYINSKQSNSSLKSFKSIKIEIYFHSYSVIL